MEATIASCTNPSQIESLENLRKDLAELLELTTEQLNELASGPQESTDPFEDEMKLFLSEIRSVEREDDVEEDDDDDLLVKIDAMKVGLTTTN